MKNVLMICIALVGFVMNAQPGPPPGHGHKEGMEKRMDLSPEQIAEIKTKQLTLQLDLSENQQVEISKINLEEATKMKQKISTYKERRERGKTAHFEAKTAMLDDKIALKKKMKTVLTETQYTKWEQGLQEKEKLRKHKMRHKKQ